MIAHFVPHINSDRPMCRGDNITLRRATGPQSTITSAAAATGLSSLASPCSAMGAHRRLGQQPEDTHLSLRLGPLTKGGLQVRVLGLAFGQRLLPLGPCLPEAVRTGPDVKKTVHSLSLVGW
jgi:hypothetical protein